MRFPRGLGPGTPVKDVPRAIAIGKAELLQHSDHDRVAIFALGPMVPMAEEIARKLEAEGIGAAVINARFAKPIDEDGGVLRRYGQRNSDARRSCSFGRVRQHRAGGTEQPLGSAPQWCARPAGLTASSSTERLIRYAKNTGSLLIPRLRNSTLTLEFVKSSRYSGSKSTLLSHFRINCLPDVFRAERYVPISVAIGAVKPSARIPYGPVASRRDSGGTDEGP